LGLIAQPYIIQSYQRDTVAFLSSIPNLPESTIESTNARFDKAIAENNLLKNIGTGLLGSVLMHGITFFIVVTILFFIGSIFFGGTAKYIKVMSMYAWVLPIWTIGIIINTPLMIIKESHGISLSPAVLMSPDITSSIFYFLKSLSLFNIWAVILMGIGLSVIYGITRAKGVVVALVVWGIWIAISSFTPYLNFQTYMMGLT
jgi:hypothetical protein